ncbi:2OG-Fe(II) oxygenase [gamma proteobacterium HTCC5015]|nr:2OG-Fe(II) oxygenase [gamma proteobacterium HTCC5015]
MNPTSPAASRQQHADDIVDELANGQPAVIDQFLSSDLCQRLRGEIQQLDWRDMPRAGVGRGEDYQHQQSERSDHIRWLRGNSTAQCQFLAQMEGLRAAINQQLFMGLFEYEAHFALYQPGAFYKKHLDAFKGRRNRIVSTVCYLNEHWHSDDAGELVIYRADQHALEHQRILPQAGRLVVFSSEDYPHEVLPSHRERYSIAGWFRLNTSRAHRIDPPR